MSLSNSPIGRRRGDDALRVVTGGGQLNGAQSFTESARRVVDYLNVHTPLTDWSVSRVARGEQVHVHVHHEQVLTVGTRVDWDESFCSRMAGGAAHVVRDSRADPDYSDLAASERVGAYAGYTIGDDRGELFGVLCGVRPSPLAEGEEVDERLVHLLSDLLSTQLVLSRGIDRERRTIELTEAAAHTDALTGVLNRRGWDRIVADAQERLSGFGDSVGIAVIDLDGLKAVNDAQGHAAGDALIKRAAEALQGACTAASHVARYGGDEFVVLSNGVVPARAEEDFGVFARALAEAGVRASLGFAAAEPGRTSLLEALEAADRMMYGNKRAGKAGASDA